jgi:hypothetical protein
MRIAHIVQAAGAARLAHEHALFHGKLGIELYGVCTRYVVLAVLALDHAGAFVYHRIMDVLIARSGAQARHQAIYRFRFLAAIGNHYGLAL